MRLEPGWGVGGWLCVPTGMLLSPNRALISPCDSMMSLSCSETFSGSFLLTMPQLKSRFSVIPLLPNFPTSLPGATGHSFCSSHVGTADL